MLIVQSAETYRYIMSVHVTLVTYRYITPTHFFNSMALVISMGLHQSLEFKKNLTQKSHRIAALSNFDCRFSPDIKVQQYLDKQYK